MKESGETYMETETAPCFEGAPKKGEIMFCLLSIYLFPVAKLSIMRQLYKFFIIQIIYG